GGYFCAGATPGSRGCRGVPEIGVPPPAAASGHGALVLGCGAEEDFALGHEQWSAWAQAVLQRGELKRRMGLLLQQRARAGQSRGLGEDGREPNASAGDRRIVREGWGRMARRKEQGELDRPWQDKGSWGLVGTRVTKTGKASPN
ncbi:hypothetical protein L7F22_045953, partial [Adiantum nelumboides]|nr:hypothetical protein [Adiantum nelumboides]